MSIGWQLAQINVGTLTAPVGDTRVAEFIDALAAINALAEASPGFVWRLKDDASEGAVDIRPAPDPLFIVNMSVWADADALFEYVYRSGHTPYMAKRRQFFERPQGAYQALWWVPTGHRPSVDEGLSRLWLIDRYGVSVKAFSFKARYPAPDEHAAPPVDMKPDPWCMGHA